MEPTRFLCAAACLLLCAAGVAAKNPNPNGFQLSPKSVSTLVLINSSAIGLAPSKLANTAFVQCYKSFEGCEDVDALQSATCKGVKCRTGSIVQEDDKLTFIGRANKGDAIAGGPDLVTSYGGDITKIISTDAGELYPGQRRAMSHFGGYPKKGEYGQYVGCESLAGHPGKTFSVSHTGQHTYLNLNCVKARKIKIHVSGDCCFDAFALVSNKKRVQVNLSGAAMYFHNLEMGLKPPKKGFKINMSGEPKGLDGTSMVFWAYGTKGSTTLTGYVTPGSFIYVITCNREFTVKWRPAPGSGKPNIVEIVNNNDWGAEFYCSPDGRRKLLSTPAVTSKLNPGEMMCAKKN